MSKQAQVKILAGFLLLLQSRLEGLPFEVTPEELIRAHSARVWIF